MNRWSPLEKILLGAFLFWSGAGLIFTLGRISPESVALWKLPAWLGAFIDGCLRTGDPILLLLAFANTHVHAARQWSPTLARRWALIVLATSLAVETLGTLTGFPFGAYHYTNRFGPLIGVVPLTIPLAWHVVVTNALFLVRMFGRSPSRPVEATLTGLACTLYDFILEPFATGTKRYWIWDIAMVPVQNYVAWFVLSGLLAGIFAPRMAIRFPRDPRPVILLAMTLLIFLAGRWA